MPKKTVATTRPESTIDGKERLRRLKRLRVITEKALKEERLDMGTWGRHSGDHAPEANNHCGTVACALGWVALDPDFQKMGVSSTWIKDEDWPVLAQRISFNGLPIILPSDAYPIFGITPGEAQGIFSVSRSMVLLRIDQTIDAYS